MSIQRIPKIFFQKSRDKLPQYIHNMIKHHLTDEWIYTNYINGDEVSYFKENPWPEFPDIIAKFNSLKRGEHKADLFRYYYLYINGGVYMDSDAMIYQPIKTIIKDYAFISINSWIPNTISNHVIAAEKQNPIIYQALRHLYTMDISILDNDFHYICKELYNIYTSFNGDKTNYILFHDISDTSGDRAIDSSGTLLFKHFWRNKENIPRHDLIYCCVFYNRDYLRLLDLLLKSMRFYSSLDSFDILIITQRDFEENIKGLGKSLGINLKTFCLDLTTIFQAACARLSIFDYPEISNYKKLLYLDTDILITSDLRPVLDNNIKDLLYAFKSGHITSHNFGGQFFNFNTINSNKSGINSGVLLFLNSLTIKELFSRMRSHIEEYTQAGTKPPYCMDQPFISYHAIKDSLYDNELLSQYINLFEGEIEAHEIKAICHFSFPIGNFWNKYSRMSEYFSKILKTLVNNNLYIDIIGKKFTWNSGYIEFFKNKEPEYILYTSWGKGDFFILDQYTVSAIWNDFCHILKFNSDYTKYISIRIDPGDFQFTSGSLINKYLNIYGDSHGSLLFNNLQIPHRNLYNHGKTIYSLGRDKYITNFHESHLNKDTTFCFIYGEIDVRVHIGKQVYYGKHHEIISRELVHMYFRTIKDLIKEYKAIIIVGIPPPVDPSDHTEHIHTPPIPFVGTNSDRVIYTNYMNKLLKEYCKEYKYFFIEPFSYYTREDGCLNYSLSDRCLHIGNNSHFLKAFNILYNLIDNQIPIVLHTCDKYKEFWKPWYYFTRKYIKNPCKIYFLSEEEDPEFVDDVIVIKTGKGEWGQRLLDGLNKIPEKYVFYMQEDFWPCKPMDLSEFSEYFINYAMDVLRITETCEYFSLENTHTENLYKFSQNSEYLMTHQFSLWNKAFFMKYINPEDNPWQNELQQSKKIAKNPHSIYLINHKWYNSTVTKGILQPIGQQMLEEMSA